MKSLIAVSGKINSGKDTVAKMIQYLTDSYQMKTKTFEEFAECQFLPVTVDWENRKFAAKLKQFVSILLDIPVEDLEKREVKEMKLGPEWTRYKIKFDTSIISKDELYLFHSYESYEKAVEAASKSSLSRVVNGNWEVEEELITVRQLMIEWATEGARNIVHPNFWVNGLFSSFKPNSQWVITDLRFLTEYRRIREENGILIRINNPRATIVQHQSETELDPIVSWDYVINNTGTINDLLEKVRSILREENLIN